VGVPLKSCYDAVIIGAGISGLTCGCFLAKEGMSVLLMDQHHRPGGCCTSFSRNGYTFDAAAHSFGSYREGGNMRLVLESLDMAGKIEIRRFTPSDIILSPDYQITFWSGKDKTVQELQQFFPDEADNILRFIGRLTDSKPLDFVALRSMTYKDLLDLYFTDDKLKAILSITVFGNGALPPSLISAFTGAKIFTEFILDGGYYPDGSMQALPDALAERFEELGGELQLSCLVKKIRTDANSVRGVVLEKGVSIRAKYVVASCDARQTIFKLLGRKVVNSEVLHEIDDLIPSLSTFILYLGIDRPFKSLPKPGTNIWFLPYYDLDKGYEAAKKGRLESIGYMVRLSPDCRTILGFVNAPFRSRLYWEKRKAAHMESFIARIEEQIIPGLSEHIVHKEAATPQTLYRYTLNYRGAAYGWATFPRQLFTPVLRQATHINGLHLTGHWTAQTQGIPGVAYLGLNTAKLIMHKEKIVN